MNDQRGKKIVIVAHCILNQNSRVQGLANFPATMKPIVETLLEHEVGIIQMPCPELLYAGYKRWAQTKDQYDTPAYRKFCREIAEQIANQIQEYTKNEVETKAIIGIKGSPTCAITETTKGYAGGDPTKIREQKKRKTKEKGILIEEIQKILKKAKIETKLIEVDSENLEKTKMEIWKALTGD
ncbi:hypothetical protein DRO54_06320 [Candidatus Bathyarchaeota archaeon]|nr:MAG: hypothetical protein DRO54_06320 [Candidatus Bathyarchaeota archaeon]